MSQRRILKFFKKPISSQRTNLELAKKSTTVAIFEVGDTTRNGEMDKLTTKRISRFEKGIWHGRPQDVAGKISQLWLCDSRGRVFNNLKAYLKNQPRYVTINHQVSGKPSLNCGLSWESILGRLLLLFIWMTFRKPEEKSKPFCLVMVHRLWKPSIFIKHRLWKIFRSNSNVAGRKQTSSEFQQEPLAIHWRKSYGFKFKWWKATNN